MVRFISVLALLLICSTSSAYGVEFTFTDVVKTKHSTVDYNELAFGRLAAYGQYEKFEYTFGSKMDVKQREPMMQAKIISTVNSPATEFEKFNILKFNKSGHEYILKLKVYVKTASVEILKKASYTPFIRLDGTSWPLQKKLAKKATDVPLPPIVPVVENAAVSRLKFTNYDEVTLRAGKQKFPVKGKIWEVEYRLDAYKKNNTMRYRAAHNLRDLLLEQSAEIHQDDADSFVFEIHMGERDYTGLVNCYDSSFQIKLVEIQAFDQSLVLSPDKLKLELDTTGQVTLEGIFFDTDKATLKPESNRALTAAGALMRQYPDLVLEVQGHTDSKGDDAHNQDLSQRRAKAVVSALVESGIPSSRLEARGFGETVPVADNSTREGRAKNRRVEMHKLSGGDKVRLIGIDFINPLPGAQLTKQRHYSTHDFMIRHTKPYSSKKNNQSFKGYDANVYDYEIMASNSRDHSVGVTEILMNYENILPLIGARLVGKYQSHLFFIFDDRGDGKILYGTLAAYQGAYEIWLHTAP